MRGIPSHNSCVLALCTHKQPVLLFYLLFYFISCFNQGEISLLLSHARKPSPGCSAGVTSCVLRILIVTSLGNSVSAVKTVTACLSGGKKNIGLIMLFRCFVIRKPRKIKIALISSLYEPLHVQYMLMQVVCL